jgi:hypothetical protein
VFAKPVRIRDFTEDPIVPLTHIRQFRKREAISESVPVGLSGLAFRTPFTVQSRSENVRGRFSENFALFFRSSSKMSGAVCEAPPARLQRLTSRIYLRALDQYGKLVQLPRFKNINNKTNVSGPPRGLSVVSRNAGNICLSR